MKNKTKKSLITELKLRVISLALICGLFMLGCGTHKNENLEEAKSDNSIVLAEFYADWCGPCKKLAPIIDEIEKEFPNIKVVRVDVDSDVKSSDEYDIKYMPTVIFFHEGKIFNRIVGLHDKSDYVEILEYLTNFHELENSEKMTKIK